MQLLGDVAKNLFVTANGVLEHADSGQASVINFCINRARCHQVNDSNGLALLPIAVDTTNPLFNPHGIPWQVVVHHAVGKLKVQTFASNLR